MRQPLGFVNRVAEEVEEEGLGEGVELGEGVAALGPQRLRPDPSIVRNPPLLRQRRQWDRSMARALTVKLGRCSAGQHTCRVTPSNVPRPQKEVSRGNRRRSCQFTGRRIDVRATDCREKPRTRATLRDWTYFASRGRTPSKLDVGHLEAPRTLRGLASMKFVQ